jgi:flagellar biosynthesis/type III secretory pathway protein FliH
MEALISRRLEQDRATIVRLLDGVAASVHRIEEEQRNRLVQWQRSAVDLAVTIATRMIHDRIMAEQFPIEAIVREAVAIQAGRGPITVRLNPADLALLESRLGGTPLLADGTGSVVVAADASQGRGNCRVETNDAIVTSRLSEQLSAMRLELLRSLGDAESGS